MKLIVAIVALILASSAHASPVPYANEVVTYANPWPSRPARYGRATVGSKGAVVPDVLGRYAYPNVYGSWPTYGHNWGYSAPVVAAKVVDNGLLNYVGYGHGFGYGLGHNKYWS